MCYADPGPRCSGHAKAKLKKTNTHYQETLKSGTEAERQNAYIALEESREQFYMTPLGQEKLRKKIVAAEDPKVKQDLQDKLDAGIFYRQCALEDIKAVDRGDVFTKAEIAQQEKARLADEEKKQKALDEAHAAKVADDAHKLELMNIDRRRRGLRELSSVNSLPLDEARGIYGNYDNSLIPQASDLDKVASVVDAVNNGASSGNALGESLSMTGREGSYYGNGAEYIGLVDKSEDGDGYQEFTLTENGRLFQQAAPEDRFEMLKDLVNATPIMKSYVESGKDLGQLEKTIEDSGYSTAVAKRRASSLVSWDKKLNSEAFTATLASSSNSAQKLSVVAAQNQEAAKKERKSKLLKTNDVKDYGYCPNHFTALPASGICSECD